MATLGNSSRIVNDFRPRVQGKFFSVGDEKLYIRGVSYGGFRPDEEGYEFPDPEVIERDFSLMAANNINTVRVYTTPPRKLLDIAQQHNLHIMVGLTGEQFVGTLLDQNDTRVVEEQMRNRVRTVVGHPAILCYTVGNEIPASIVRWLGPKRVEGYLKWLYQIVKEEDPGSIV